MIPQKFEKIFLKGFRDILQKSSDAHAKGNCAKNKLSHLIGARHIEQNDNIFSSFFVVKVSFHRAEVAGVNIMLRRDARVGNRS